MRFKTNTKPLIRSGRMLKTIPVTLKDFLLQPISPKMQKIIPVTIDAPIVINIAIATVDIWPEGTLYCTLLQTDIEITNIKELTIETIPMMNPMMENGIPHFLYFLTTDILKLYSQF